MIEKNYNVIGIMSGTSLDGVDLAHIKFIFKDGNWAFEIHETQTISYTKEWLDRLKNAISFTKEELNLLDKDYTLLLSGIINSFMTSYDIANIDAVCSHGHTILHQPQNGFTLQIGNLPQLAQLINQKVVCNFRVQDVALGGQGAPLVPIGDRLLFANYDYCLNLGGFSNISFEENNRRIAFDICPVNTVLNFYANQLDFDYDDGGKIAQSNFVYTKLLEQLNSLGFYTQPYPKSLGFEYVKETVLPLIETHPISIEDKISTFTEHIAQQIANTIINKGAIGRLLITGGGAYNTHLISRLKQFLPDTQITVPDDKTIQFKEALIFAFLGVLKLRNEVNTLSSVTGASADHSSGFIYEP
jgi:anhydro-N-acetylmuramic acid kinase